MTDLEKIREAVYHLTAARIALQRMTPEGRAELAHHATAEIMAIEDALGNGKHRAAVALGSLTSEKKKVSSANNGKKGGWWAQKRNQKAIEQ